MYRRDRLRRRGGGVCIYLRDNIIANTINVPSMSIPNVEILWVSFCMDNIVFYLAGVYHPPKPVFSIECLKTALTQDIDFIHSIPGNLNIILAGDFNSFAIDFFTCELGLSYLQTGPTHGSNVIDRFFVSVSDLFSVNVYPTLLKTKHRLLILSASSVKHSPQARPSTVK